jgi:hypothetical protein
MEANLFSVYLSFSFVKARVCIHVPLPAFYKILLRMFSPKSRKMLDSSQTEPFSRIATRLQHTSIH